MTTGNVNVNVIPPRSLKTPYNPNAALKYEDTIEKNINRYIKAREEFDAKHIDTYVLSSMTYFDYDAVLTIGHMFDGFMIEPTAIVGKRTIEAVSRVADTWQELIDGINAVRSKGKIYLMSLMYSCSYPSFIKLDETTFYPERLLEPRMTRAYWKLRYGTLTFAEYEDAISAASLEI